MRAQLLTALLMMMGQFEDPEHADRFCKLMESRAMDTMPDSWVEIWDELVELIEESRR